MMYRIFGGIFLVLIGLTLCGVTIVPNMIVGFIGVIAGIALLAAF